MEVVKVLRQMHLKLLWGVVFVGFLGAFSYFRLLPSLFPVAKSIEAESLTGEYDSKRVSGEYLGKKVASREIASQAQTRVLGANESNKRIMVDLTNQRLYAYEGEVLVYEFLISSGKWFPTPTGTFRIWGKFRYTKMEGGNPLWNTYYYLPNVPYVMFFSNDKVTASRGFSLHGTYWHQNFGHPMSHGCVNMRTEDAGTLFYWTQPTVGDKKAIRANKNDPGTEVIIYGQAPRE